LFRCAEEFPQGHKKGPTSVEPPRQRRSSKEPMRLATPTYGCPVSPQSS
jgi:hypothetical protein